MPFLNRLKVVFKSFIRSQIWVFAWVLSPNAIAQTEISPPKIEPALSGDPILLVLGGFMSCAKVPGTFDIQMKFEKSILEYRYQVMRESGKVPLVVRGCFVNSLKEGNTYYFSGLSEQVMSLRISGFFGLGADQNQELKFLIKALGYAVMNQAKKLKNPIVFIAGHSQGAWLGTEVASFLAGRATHVGALLTMDPISPLYCNPGEYLNRLGGPAPGCVTSPPDWSHEFVSQTLGSLNNAWYNYYQTQFLFLHSGPVHELDFYHQNIELFFPFDGNIRPAHTKLDDRSEPWIALARRSAQVLREVEPLSVLNVAHR